jgi:DNA processing protein
MDETENKIRVRKIIIALSLIHKGDWQKIMHAVQHHEVPEHDIEELAGSVKCKVTTIIDKDYPEGLRHAQKPPFALFYYGDLSLLNDSSKVIAYVGSRMASEYGVKMATDICGELSDAGFAIASGSSIGIDAAAERAASERGKAVMVLGNGIDYVYPSSNAEMQKTIAEKGLVISEYPGDTPPTPDKFAAKNRIIAGISNAVVVGEAHKHSGTLITVSFALNMGRDVMAVPYHGDEDSACNLLIKEGATLVENANDILACLGVDRIGRRTPGGSKK